MFCLQRNSLPFTNVNYLPSDCTSVPSEAYVAKLAQRFEKLAQQILWEWVKNMLFLNNLANFYPKLMNLAQDPLQFCQIW